LSVPGAGSLPPALDVDPRPGAAAAAPTSAVTYASELFQSRSRPAPPVPDVRAPVTPEMARRVDLPPVAGMVGGPVPGRFVVQSNRPEVITTIPEGGAVAFSSRNAPNGVNHAFKPGETVTFGIFNQNLTGGGLTRTLAVRNEGSEPLVLKTNAYSSVSTAQAPYLTVTDNGTPRTNHESVRPNGPMDGPGMAAAANAMAGRSQIAREIVVPPGKTVIVAADAFPNRQELMTHGSFTIGQPPGGTGDARATFDIVMTQGKPTPETVDRLVASGPMVPVGPKEPTPTPLAALENGQFSAYGRVNGVAQAGEMQLTMANNGQGNLYVLPENGEAGSQSFIWNTKYTARGGAPLDTPYMTAAAEGSAPMNHGMYGTEFEMTLPAYNPSDKPQLLQVTMGSGTTGDSAAFRGNLKVAVTGPDGSTRTQTVAVMQRSGTDGTTPVAEVLIPPGGRGNVTVSLIYPPNTTPPHTFKVTNRPVQ
jgi:hypothetical protein